MMVVTVTFALGDAFDATQLGRLAAEAAPRFEKIPGLRSKTFTVDAVRREAVNIYQWDDDAAAQAFFNEALREQVTQVYGVPPRIDFLPVLAQSQAASPPARGPARSGVVIYACDLERLAGFYETAIGMQRRVADAEHVVLASADTQFILHAIPPAFRALAVAGSAADPRTAAAIKPFLSVADLDAVADSMARHGGELFPEVWQGPGFRMRNGCDCEGNVLQLREWVR
jgi:predicted enzyme related to lactoylglutathione lyase